MAAHLAGDHVGGESIKNLGVPSMPVVSLDSVYEIRPTRACSLYPPEARDTFHFRSASSAPVVRGWRPAFRVAKRRNSLTRCAPWPKVIRFPEPHPGEGLDRPPMPAGMTDEAWTRASPAERSHATRLSRPARPVSDQRHFVALLYTLS